MRFKSHEVSDAESIRINDLVTRAHLAGSSQEPKLIAALEKALEALEELKNTVVSECADGDISRFHHNPGMAARWLDYATDPIVREIASAGAAEDSEEME